MSIIEKALAKRRQKQKQKQTAQTIANSQSVDEQQIKEESLTAAKIEIDEPDLAKTTKIENTSNINSDNYIELNGESLVERGFIFDPAQRKETQEEFRAIKRKLLNNAFGPASKTLNNSNLIMVTSSNPDEGKTFISINLALSIALEQDKTVLLIDADVLRPSLNHELGFGDKKGLLEYLLSEINSLQQIIYGTNIPNLKIIPAGVPHNLTNELLASDRMISLANELAARYPNRVVIFDCPPILGVNETPILSTLMGQAIIVVEESKTKLVDVVQATSQLTEDIALGIVMNKTLKSTKDTYGYYGYGNSSEDK